MTTQRPNDKDNAAEAGTGINPSLKRAVDTTFSDDQHGSDPMESVSVKNRGPEVWPIIWAIVAIVLAALTAWLLF